MLIQRKYFQIDTRLQRLLIHGNNFYKILIL